MSLGLQTNLPIPNILPKIRIPLTQQIQEWWGALENKEEIDKAIRKAIDEGMFLAELEPLGLDERTCNALEGEDIYTVEDLLRRSLTSIFNRSGNYIGPAALWQIVRALSRLPSLNEQKKNEYLRSLAPNLDDIGRIRKFGLEEILGIEKIAIMN